MAHKLMSRCRGLSDLIRSNPTRWHGCCQHCLSKDSSIQQRRSISFWGTSKPATWSKAVSDAEKIVGYPTSFMSLRCLLSDELSNVALHMRKLVGTKHPLLKTARKFLLDGKHSLQTRGLLVLLMSKAAGPGPDLMEKMVSGIYPSQRTLAEITEMIHTASLIHTGVVNLKEVLPQESNLNDMEFGNKMSVLSGDFLLANASTGLASLENTKVVEIMSSAIGDIMEAEFSLHRDITRLPMLPDDGMTIDAWLALTEKASASLIGKSCKASVMLPHHDEELQQKAYEFGTNMAIAHQIHDDLLPYTNPLEECNGVTVLNAPVILHLNQYPEQQQVQQILETRTSQPNALLKLLENSPAIDESKALCQHYGKKALGALESFPKSESQSALKNIIRAVTS